MVLKATVYDMRHLALCHDEFRGPRSSLCRSGGIGNNKKTVMQDPVPSVKRLGTESVKSCVRVSVSLNSLGAWFNHDRVLVTDISRARA
ncbi:hypothetical protein TNCV_932531 [Trichonephila clavipes]|nr:hypothetical protein TNCV_932531 [Trichonephila clavipes]